MGARGGTPGDKWDLKGGKKKKNFKIASMQNHLKNII